MLNVAGAPTAPARTRRCWTNPGTVGLPAEVGARVALATAEPDEKMIVGVELKPAPDASTATDPTPQVASASAPDPLPEVVICESGLLGVDPELIVPGATIDHEVTLPPVVIPVTCRINPLPNWIVSPMAYSVPSWLIVGVAFTESCASRTGAIEGDPLVVTLGTDVYVPGVVTVTNPIPDPANGLRETGGEMVKSGPMFESINVLPWV